MLLDNNQVVNKFSSALEHSLPYSEACSDTAEGVQLAGQSFFGFKIVTVGWAWDITGLPGTATFHPTVELLA